MYTNYDFKSLQENSVKNLILNPSNNSNMPLPQTLFPPPGPSNKGFSDVNPSLQQKVVSVKVLTPQEVQNRVGLSQQNHQTNYNFEKTLNTISPNSQVMPKKEEETFLQNVIGELKIQNQSKDEMIAKLQLENLNLQSRAQNAEKLQIQTNDLISQKNNLVATIKANDLQLANLQQEYRQVVEKNAQLMSQVSQMMSKYPSNFRVDTKTEKIITTEEWNLMNKNKELEQKVALLQKERDKLYLDNYEWKKMNNQEMLSLDDTQGEIMQLKYQNNLQMAELQINRLKTKLQQTEEEKNFIQNELDAIRKLDLGGQNEIV